jgi:hypothetical protein
MKNADVGDELAKILKNHGLAQRAWVKSLGT